MQYAPIEVPFPVRTGEWVRKRQNWKLYRIVSQPLRDLDGTPNDPWSRVMVNGVWRPVHTPNPVWEAAVAEFNRRFDLYERCVPFAKWGVS